MGWGGGGEWGTIEGLIHHVGWLVPEGAKGVWGVGVGAGGERGGEWPDWEGVCGDFRRT